MEKSTIRHKISKTIYQTPTFIYDSDNLTVFCGSGSAIIATIANNKRWLEVNLTLNTFDTRIKQEFSHLYFKRKEIFNQK